MGGDDTDIIVKVVATPSNFGGQCPFTNPKVEITLRRGDCVRLGGPSGAGKTSICSAIAGLSTPSRCRKIGIEVSVEWNSAIPSKERCGALFQSTTLIDSLTVAGNVAAALESAASAPPPGPKRLAEIKRLVEAVGLDFARDGGKSPGELSGGMARRASLALQIAQRKRVVILDEPFTGLDTVSAASVAKELCTLRAQHGTALLLVSHQPEIVALVMNKSDPHVELVPLCSEDARQAARSPSEVLKQHHFSRRFSGKVVDYVCWSAPLIALAFIASGLAIAMLSCDLLNRLDVTDYVVNIVKEKVGPVMKLLTGKAPDNATLWAVGAQVRGMVNEFVPGAKATIHAVGMAKLFVLEIGPLLTALLLCGRIGGSYAGEVATMAATAQNKLLLTLGISPRKWSLLPSILAALIASPLLTLLGVSIALWLGAWTGEFSGITTTEKFYEEAWNATFTDLTVERLANSSSWDCFVEISQYPPLHMYLKSTTFMSVIMGVAELVARWDPDLPPRLVSRVITVTVVTSGLGVIVADWGFSRILLLRTEVELAKLAAKDADEDEEEEEEEEETSNTTTSNSSDSEEEEE